MFWVPKEQLMPPWTYRRHAAWFSISWQQLNNKMASKANIL